MALYFVSVYQPNTKEPRAMIIYCAICGAPHREVDLRPQPRTTAYDCDIITKEETEWMQNVALLGFNPTARGHDQSGPHYNSALAFI